MKKKSLIATFALVAGVVAMGAGSAQAQTVPINGGGQQVYTQTAATQATAAPVSQSAIDDLSYNVGVQTAYYRAGVGFTQGTTTSGENVGLEFQLQGNNATVIKAYNLNDPYSRSMFQQEVNNASSTDQSLASQQYYNQANYNYYAPSSYVICAPIRPIIPFGFSIGGWYVGYTPIWMMPTYSPWAGYWNGGHRAVNHTTVINNTIIERGGTKTPWVGGVNGRTGTGTRTVVGTQTVNRTFNNIAPANANIHPNVTPRETTTLPQQRVVPQQRIVPQERSLPPARAASVPQSNVRIASGGGAVNTGHVAAAPHVGGGRTR